MESSGVHGRLLQWTPGTKAIPTLELPPTSHKVEGRHNRVLHRLGTHKLSGEGLRTVTSLRELTNTHTHTHIRTHTEPRTPESDGSPLSGTYSM